MSVSKGKSGWSAQRMQDEVFETEYSTYFNRSYAERPCALLPLRLGAQQLVQTLDEHIYGIGPRLGSARKKYGLLPSDRLRSAERQRVGAGGEAEPPG